MPRSSRHKSSKHTLRDVREYSDSEKDSSSKDRKSKEESSAKVSKEFGSGEKRKLESKDNKDSFGAGNGEYVEEYLTSKRRKEKVEGGVNDRWNGGDDDRGEGTKKLKEKSSEFKSKRRDESAGEYDESDEVVKKSSGKTEGKHRESSGRKEGREGGAERERDREREREKERDRRVKEGKTEKVIDGDDMRVVKQVSEKTDLSVRDLLQSLDTENQPDRRMRRKRDDFGDGDKHRNDIGDTNDRRLSLREDFAKDGKPKDEKRRDEKYRDKYREDVDRESRHRDDKQKDEHAVKDHISSRSDDKYLKDDKDSVGTRPKKYKPQNGDRERDHDRDRDFNVDWDHDHESYRRDKDRDRDHDRDREQDWDCDCDRDWDRDRDLDCDRERDRERDHDREKNIDYDGVHVDDRNARHRDNRGRKISPDDHDDYADAKSRGAKTAYLDMEKKSLSSSRIESDTDRGRSHSRQAHPDNNASSNRKRTSPNTSLHGAADEYRQFKQEELKHRDAMIEHRSKSISSREVTSLPGASERNSKYRSSEKLTKMDDGHMEELSLERSSSSKASPMGLVDRSPSSTSMERRYTHRSGVRRSLDIEESGRRSGASMGARDLPSADDRPSRDLPLEKSLVDDSTSVDSSFYNRTSRSNSAFIPPSFRGGVGSPSLMGSLEEDSRISTGSRYKRSEDPNLGRGHGNAWRGAPNWSSPLPNGYIPFQHGPPHGGFQAMLPQFPTPPFGVRPSMEINHSGIPYHIPDADRFSSHLRPLGWQNIMDSSGPSHMHGWDGNNGVFRDEVHIYGGSDWDQNRLPMSGRGWEGNADIWKGQNGDASLDLSSTSLKEGFPLQAPVDDVSAGQGGQRLQNESKHLGVQAKTVETKIVIATSEKESYKSSPKTIHERTADPPKSLSNDSASLYHAYLSKLDISTELADPELYDQLMSLLNIGESVAAAEEDAAMLVNLKDGARAVPKSSSILLSSSLFPATSDSVFMRAMGIYKRQRASFGGLTIANGGTMNISVLSNIEEEVPHNDVNIAKEPVPNDSAAISDGKMLNSNETNVDIVPDAALQEISEVTPNQEMDVDAGTPDLKLESSGQGLSHDIPEKSMMVSSGDEMQTIPSKLVNSEDHEGDFVSSPCDVPNTAKDVSNDVHKTDKIGKMKSSSSLNFGEEGQGFGEAICDGLIFSEDSPKSSGALKPGSNESESVILSRIHHSPESTH